MKFSRPIEFNPTSSNDFTFDEYALDVLAAPFRGLEGLGHGIYNLGDFVSFDVLPDWDEQRLLGRSKTTAGSLVEGITQFAVPFGAIGKGLSYAGKAARAGTATGVLGKAGKAMTKTGSGKFTDLNGLGYLSAGMASDFVAFDGQEQRLSNLIQQFPELQNPVTEFLAADEGDSELLGRTKNVLEGILIELGVGAVLKPFMAGLRAVKTRGREISKGASKEDAVKSALLEYGDDMASDSYVALDAAQIKQSDGLGQQTFSARKSGTFSDEIDSSTMELLKTGRKVETIKGKTYETISPTGGPAPSIDNVLKSLSKNANSPEVKKLAQGLRKIIKDQDDKDVLVTLSDDAGDPSKIRGGSTNKVQGSYSPSKDRIVLFPKADEQTLVHEMLHGVTARKINAWVKHGGDERAVTLENIDNVIKNRKAPKPIRELASSFKEAMEEFKRLQKTGYGPTEQGKMLYAFKDLDEFLVAAFTDYDLQKLLRRMPSSDNRTVFQKIVDAVKDMLGYSHRADGSLLDKVLRDSAQIISAGRPEYIGKASLVERGLWSIKSTTRSLTSDQLSKLREDKNLPEKLRKDGSHPTQIATTVTTYKKVKPQLNEGKTIDFGAGKNIANKAGIKADTYEPFPEKDFDPTFSDASTIPDNSYDNVINNAVLNVVPQDIRDGIVKDIGRILKPGGKGFVNVRGKDVFGAKHTVVNKDNAEVIVDSTGAYQKGFTDNELVDYLEDVLGDGFDVRISSKEFGTVSAVITKRSDDAMASVRGDLSETLDKITARNVETGGVQAVRGTGAGKMKDPKTGEITSTIDGGLQQQELDTLLEAGSEKLLKEGKVGAEFTEGKANAIAVQEMADATGADKGTLEGLLNASAGDKLAQQRIAGRMLALRRFMGANGLDLIEMAEQYSKGVKDGQPDELLAATIKSKMDMQLHIQARASELASGFGQGLRSTQFKAKVGLSPKEIANTKLRQEYLRRRGGMDINDIVNNILMAKDGSGDDLFNTIIALNKTVRGANGGMFTKMVREYYINSLLWGPRTMTVNFLGNGISSNIRQFERYIGGWLSADPKLRAGVVNSWSLGVFSKELWTFFSKAWKAGDSLLDNAGGTFKGDVGNEQAVGAITGENMGQALDALRGTKGALEGADTFKTAIDYIGKAVRIPSKFLVSTDELYKQLEFRRRAMAQLWMQAGERGLTNPEDIAKYVTETVEGLVTNSGRHFSEASLIKDASDAADKMDFKDHVERERFMADNVEQARAEKLEFAREKGLVDNDEDLGALQQLSEQWVEPNLQSARNVTFTDELTDPVSKGIQQLFSKMPMGWIIMPFIKAPTNILKFSFGRALALFRVGYEAAAEKVFPGLTANRDTFIKQLNSEDALVRAEAQGKLATGVVMNTALLTTMFAFKDKITGGGPLDTRQKRMWEAAGNRPYSIKIGDTWVSYQRLDPIATMVGVAADMISVMDDSIHAYDAEIGEKALAAMMVTFARNVTNKSYLAGIDQFMKAMTQPEKSAEATLSRIAAGFVPNVLYQGQSLEGDQELKEIRSLGDAFYKKLPGLSDRLDLRRNILGEAYEAEMFEAGPSEVINPFNPIAFSTKTNDPILTEMANLHHGFSPPSHKLSRLVDLTQFTASNGRSAYDRWLELHSEVKVRNKTLRQALQGLINSKRYKSLDPRSTPGLPSPRASLITRVLSDYRSKALKQMLQEFPEAKRMYDQASSAKTMSRRGASYDDVLSLLQQ